jgi:hypothetical protein
VETAITHHILVFHINLTVLYPLHPHLAVGHEEDTNRRVKTTRDGYLFHHRQPRRLRRTVGSRLISIGSGPRCIWTIIGDDQHNFFSSHLHPH